MTSQIDPTKSYKTYYTKTYLDGIDPAIYTFLVTKGYSNGSETIVAGEYLDGALLVANQTEPDVIVDAAGDPVCFWGLNGCGGTSTPVAIEDANGNVTVLNGNGNIPTDCSLEVTGGVLGVTPIVVNPPIAIGTSITTGVISGVISSAINSVDYTNQSTCRDVLVRVVSIIYVNRQLSSLGGVNGNMMSTHSTLFDNGSGVLVVDNSVVPQMSSYGQSSIDYNLFKIHPIVVPANSTITLRTQSQVGINSASNYAAIAAETASTIYVITEGYVN